MSAPDEATLLRVFIGESDRHDGKPLYEAIVLKARELHLAGATVRRPTCCSRTLWDLPLWPWGMGSSRGDDFDDNPRR